MPRYFCALVVAICVYTPVVLLALPSAVDENLEWDLVDNSVLLPVPSRMSAYAKNYSKLNSKEKLRRKVYGLRMKPLNPAVWGIRVKDRTENRNLVPMRPYFLRASELRSFHLKQVEVSFAFTPAGKKRMRHDRTSTTPMIDIGVAGRFRPRSEYERGELDDEYVVRITSSPLYSSGVYFRSFNKFSLLKKIDYEFQNDTNYDLRLAVKGKKLVLEVNGVNVLDYGAKGSLERGLLQLRTAWHPVKVDKLQVKGVAEIDGKWRNIVRSGVVENA